MAWHSAPWLSFFILHNFIFHPLTNELIIERAPWLSFFIFFHEGPPHSMMPRRWNVARYVPRGDHCQIGQLELSAGRGAG